LFYDDEFDEITQNEGRYTVQGHWRSPILVQIDFPLVINTNVPPILHRFRDIAFNGPKIAIFRYPSCVLSRRWGGSLHHVTGSDISLKTTCFGLHNSCWKFRYIFNHFYAVCRESYRIRWNNAE